MTRRLNTRFNGLSRRISVLSLEIISRGWILAAFYIGWTISSCVKGTKTSIEEALCTGREMGPERGDDWQEVENYNYRR